MRFFKIYQICDLCIYRSLIRYMTRKGSDKFAHAYSLAITFTARIYKLHTLLKGPGQRSICESFKIFVNVF